MKNNFPTASRDRVASLLKNDQKKFKVLDSELPTEEVKAKDPKDMTEDESEEW